MAYVLTRIDPSDQESMIQVYNLLNQNGLSLENRPDDICGLFDEKGHHLLATGSACGSSLRCFAVDRKHRGEGLLNQVVSYLTARQAERGNTHLFIYTKPENAKFFKDLGYYEIATAGGTVSFLENRKHGFEDYCEALAKTNCDKQAAAVVMNANPFTLGHQYLIEQAASAFETVHVFVLSQEFGPIPASIRRNLVRAGISHLSNVICHDSGPYIISKATFPSYFIGDTDTVIQAQAALDLAIFKNIASRLNIVCRYVGEEQSSQSTTLYNEAMIHCLPKLDIKCCVIPRLKVGGQPVSASIVRRAIHDGRLEDIRPLVPVTTWEYFISQEAQPVIHAIQKEKDVIHR